MIEIFQDFFGDISGYRPKYFDMLSRWQDCEDKLVIVTAERDAFKTKLGWAKEEIRQLELLVPREPPPKLTSIFTKDTLWVQSRIDAMKLGIVRFPLDQVYKATTLGNWLNIIAWDWTDRLEYIKERFDCENFSFLFKAYTDLYFGINTAGLVLDYVSGHSYILILYADGTQAVYDPQYDGLYVWTQRPIKFYDLRGAKVDI